MPQPAKKPYDNLVTDKSLTPDQFKAIGGVATEWAHLELALGLALSKFSGALLEATMLLITNMTAKGTIDSVGGLASARLTKAQWKEYSPLLGRCSTLSGKRNTLVHASWSGIDKSGRAIAMELKARRDGLTVDYIFWTTKEIEQVAIDIRKLFDELNMFLIRHKLWNGTLFE